MNLLFLSLVRVAPETPETATFQKLFQKERKIRHKANKSCGIKTQAAAVACWLSRYEYVFSLDDIWFFLVAFDFFVEASDTQTKR